MSNINTIIKPTLFPKGSFQEKIFNYIKENETKTGFRRDAYSYYQWQLLALTLAELLSPHDQERLHEKEHFKLLMEITLSLLKREEQDKLFILSRKEGMTPAPKLKQIMQQSLAYFDQQLGAEQKAADQKKIGRLAADSIAISQAPTEGAAHRLATGVGLGRAGATVGTAVSKLLATKDTVSNQLSAVPKLIKLGGGFHYASLIFSVLNLVAIPALVLRTYWRGEKIPPDQAQQYKIDFGVSAIVVGLLVAGIVAAPVAGPLALATATVLFATDIVHLVRHIKYGQQLQAEIVAVDKKLVQLHEEKQQQETEANELELKVLTLRDKWAENPNATAHELKVIAKQLTHVEVKRNDLMQQIAIAEINKQQLQSAALEHGQAVKLLDKAAGTWLGGVAVMGAIIALFAPPVGLGILAAAGALGVTYLTGRLAYAYWQNKTKPQAEYAKPVPQPQARELEEEIDDSTRAIAKNLYGEKAHYKLAELIARTQRWEQIDQHLKLILAKQDEREVLKFFSEVAAIFERRHLPKLRINMLMERFMTLDRSRPTADLLAKAINAVTTGKIELTAEDQQHILSLESYFTSYASIKLELLTKPHSVPELPHSAASLADDLYPIMRE